MFHKLHWQMTLFCTLVTGGIFLALTCICLFFAENSLRSNDYTLFLRQLNSVLVHLQEQDTISHQWLNQLQVNNQVVLFLYDNNQSLCYQEYHHSEWEESLQQEVIQTASGKYQMDIFASQPQHIVTHTEFEFGSSAGEQYYVSAGVIPRDDKWMSFTMLFPLEWQQKQIAHLRFVIALSGFAAVFLLFIFSWFFTKRMIIPIEKNRANQIHFIASVSHELRAPLSVLRTGLETLRKTDNLEERQRFMNYMEEESIRMQHLVSDMLLLANADSGRLPIHSELCQPDELLLAVYEKYEPVAWKKKIVLSIDFPDIVFADCYCDRERMTQVFVILLENALSYTPAGGRIRLSMKMESKEFRFMVSDTGCGIPDEDKERIFERFYRADDAHTDKAHFGLGLCIAKEIVTAHQGKIRMEDSAEGGSCCIVTLPIK